MMKFVALLGIRRIPDCRFASTRITADGKEVPKQKYFENRITLIGIDNSVSITDLKNAQNMSLRRELKLIKIQDVDSKTRRPVYKLMTNAEYHSEELEKRKEKQEARQKNTLKAAKLLNLSTKIGDHDLMTGVKKMMKLLEKQHEVKVVIVGEGETMSQKSERIYSIIEEKLKSFGKVVQKRHKGNSLRFQLLPTKHSNTDEVKDSTSSHNEGDKGPL
ncbi:translation initiation factor IF-3 [Plodia interpunctella]|uniref:translation initiation factor IF-3 n=1 Tax=Plodia interpunctella TaxID=58824 RepID=UPI00236896DB|nr:translation initiation factor IF-3 [Plodia interpunctella]